MVGIFRFEEKLKKILRKTAAGIALALIFVFCIASLTACSRAEQYFVYGTELSIETEGASGGKYIERAYEFIRSLENVLSPTVQDSDLWRINNGQVGVEVECDAHTMSVMGVAQRVYQISDGAYDPSVYPLVRLWGFAGDQFANSEHKTLPSDADIASALELVGLSDAFAIDYENSTITKLKEGAMLDFGGVAKGYAVANALKLFDGVKALVDLGGNIGASNKDVKIGIGNPDRPDRGVSSTGYFGTVPLLAGECISTSGDYQRYFTIASADKQMYYHHIIDPRTGYPSKNNGSDGLISVTVISSDGALGDAVSTAAMVLGKSAGGALIETLNLCGVLIASDMSFNVVGKLSFTKK